jgi:hypothetical protein
VLLIRSCDMAACSCSVARALDLDPARQLLRGATAADLVRAFRSRCGPARVHAGGRRIVRWKPCGSRSPARSGAAPLNVTVSPTTELDRRERLGTCAPRRFRLRDSRARSAGTRRPMRAFRSRSTGPVPAWSSASSRQGSQLVPLLNAFQPWVCCSFRNRTAS